MEVSKEALELLTAKGFDSMYFKKLADARTNQEAYEMTEEVFKTNFGKRKYSSYDSFRISMYRRISAR